MSAPDGERADVLLASLPFGLLESPSLALGLLQSRLEGAGISTIARYLTLDYAGLVGIEGYRHIVAGFPRTTDLLGEWIFSHAVHPRDPRQDHRYLDRTFGAVSPVSGRAGDDHLDALAAIKDGVIGLAATAGDFADFAAREILRHRPKVVGLTTVFQQNLATIAVASRLRALDPSVRIMVGGANCEGPMGRALADSYPVFDAVVSGEADLLVVPLVQHLLARVPGPLGSSVLPFVDSVSSTGVFLEAALMPHLDGYVTPSFQDYFRERDGLVQAGDLPVEVPLESSRGCWWGAKHHCTFCGLNGATMSFRSRSPEDVLSEVVSISKIRPDATIAFVDNIMDHRYYKTFLPRLAELELPMDLFYEVKSNITRAQVQSLKAAGVSRIQPGIESLSDQVLEIMRKGVSALQNIQLLKWCMEFGIRVDWNILCGFPGEDPDEYEQMAALVPLICHLQPPARCSEIRLDRFSPNFEQAQEIGFSNVRPCEAYFDVHPGLPREAVTDLAYFFEADSSVTKTLPDYTRSLLAAVDGWRASHTSSRLVFIDVDRRVVVFDSRTLRPGPEVVILDPTEAQVLMACDTVGSIPSMLRSMPGSTAGEVEAAVERLCGRGYLVGRGGRYLALPVALPGLLEARAANLARSDRQPGTCLRDPT